MSDAINLRAVGTETPLNMHVQTGALVKAVSPTVQLDEVEGGVLMTVTDIDGSQSALIPAGPAGPQGETGPQGERGSTGDRGLPGLPGDDGYSPTVEVTNISGSHIVNITDKNGEHLFIVKDGDDGIQGPKGDPGLKGVTFTPSVSEEGVISWTNDGGKTNPESVNIKGPQGPQGEQGPPGSDATVTVDTALSGTSENPVQNKVITGETKSIRDAIVAAGYAPVESPASWTLGNWATSNGTAGSRTDRIRTTKNTQINSLDYYVKADAGVLITVLFYSGADTYVAQTEYPWLAECSVAAMAPSGATGFRLMVRTEPAADLTDVVDSTAAKVHFYKNRKQDQLTFDSVPTSGSQNPVTSGGIYTAINAKADPVTVETVTGTDPVIVGVDNHRYMCGTCDTLTITPPQSGVIDVVFRSGTTPTVLSNMSNVMWPGWFDPEHLDASTTYELNIMDNKYGAVMAWT